MKNKDKIEIVNEKSICFHTFNEYSRHIFSCDIIVRRFFESELLAKYNCQYMVKEVNGVKYFEHPQYDISETLEVLAPSCWAVSSVTEHFSIPDSINNTKKPIITATFNIYKQLHSIGNKRYYDTKTAFVFH